MVNMALGFILLITFYVVAYWAADMPKLWSTKWWAFMITTAVVINSYSSLEDF